MRWTEVEQGAAEAEGWWLSNGPDGETQLQRVDEMGTFDEDAEAWRHVYGRAVDGSPLHLMALQVVAAENPTEMAYVLQRADA